MEKWQGQYSLIFKGLRFNPPFQPQTFWMNHLFFPNFPSSAVKYCKTTKTDSLDTRVTGEAEELFMLLNYTISLRFSFLYYFICCIISQMPVILN